MRSVRAGILVLSIGGCLGRAPMVTPDRSRPQQATVVEEVAVVHRGAVRNGVYRTPSPGFEIPIPGGWTWTEGPPGTSLQLRIHDEASGMALEVWRFSGTDPNLRPREGCPWTFVDQGTYTGPGGRQSRTVATCVPVDAQDPRVFAWMVASPEAAWQIEGHVPPGLILEGDASIRWLVDRFVLVP